MAENKRRSMKDRVRDAAKESQSGASAGVLKLTSNAKFFKATKGTVSIDILPYEVSDPKHTDIPKYTEIGELWYRKPFLQHNKIGPMEKRFVCPSTVGLPCPICEFRNEMKRDPNHDEEYAKKLAPQKRELFNVIDLANEKEGVQILNISFATFGKKLFEEITENSDEDVGNFAELEGGYTLKARFIEKSGGSFKFLECSRIDFEERDDYKDSILDEVNDFDKMLIIPSYSELFSAFHGSEAPDPAESSNSDDRSSRSSRSSRHEEKEEPRAERPSRRSSREEKEEPKEEKPSRSRRSEPEEKEPEKEPESHGRSRRSEPEKEEKPTRSRRSEPEEKESEEKDLDPDSCPSGGVFGDDYKSLDECEGCPNDEQCEQVLRDKKAAEEKPSGRGRSRRS